MKSPKPPIFQLGLIVAFFGATTAYSFATDREGGVGTGGGDVFAGKKKLSIQEVQATVNRAWKNLDAIFLAQPYQAAISKLPELIEDPYYQPHIDLNNLTRARMKVQAWTAKNDPIAFIRNTKLVAQKAPCHRYVDKAKTKLEEADASYFVDVKGVCVSLGRLQLKTDRKNVLREVVALLAHEISHAAGTSEPEADEFQKELAERLHIQFWTDGEQGLDKVAGHYIDKLENAKALAQKRAPREEICVSKDSNEAGIVSYDEAFLEAIQGYFHLAMPLKTYLQHRPQLFRIYNLWNFCLESAADGPFKNPAVRSVSLKEYVLQYEWEYRNGEYRTSRDFPGKSLPLPNDTVERVGQMDYDALARELDILLKAVKALYEAGKR